MLVRCWFTYRRNRGRTVNLTLYGARNESGHKRSGARGMSDAIRPALKHRIPLELQSYACLGESSTRMGDLLGSPRVAPLRIFFFPCFFFLFPSRVVRLSYSFLHGSPGPPTWAHARSHVLVRGLGGSMGGVGSGQKGTVFRSETGLRARLVAPRRPDALSGEIPSFWPPNGRRFFFFPQFGYLLWLLVSNPWGEAGSP